MMPAQSTKLPRIRQDLQLRQGAPTLNGNATWLIYDPVRHRYFSVEERIYQIVSIWSDVTAEELAVYASEALDAHISEDDINDILNFLYSNNLADTPPDDDPFAYARQSAAAERNFFTKAIHNYLFFRIPLWRPEAFLTATYGMVRPLFSPAALYFYLASALIGLYFVSRQWDAFTSTFLHFFTLEGMALYLLSLIFIKTLHEMGHAYMAHRFGVRVNTMGVAFLVMLPVLYTDVTDAWSLRSRKKKLLIDGAGLIVELIVAAIATLLWVFLPDGALRSAAFLLATTSWILSVFVNLNPFMRFDGYYILADAWGIPNLQPRAFAQATWWIREVLFGLNEPVPEPFSKRTRALLITYAIGVWIYRFFLFIGIALIVYQMFFKVLGVALFVVEILFFILLPIWREMKIWWQMRDRISETHRSRITACTVSVFVLALIVPWSTTVHVPSVYSSQRDVTVYAQQPAKIVKINIQDGQVVKAGEELLRLESPRLVQSISQTRKKIKLLKARIARVAGDRADLSQLQVLKKELNSELERLEGLQRETRQLNVIAPAGGVVRDMDAHIHPGRWINQAKPLFNIVGKSEAAARGYVKEELLWRLTEGQEGFFIADDPLIPRIRVQLDMVAPTGTSQLDNLYLASVFGGPIATTPEADNKLRMTEGRYYLHMGTDVGPSQKALKGVVVLEGRAESFIASAWRQVMRVLVREANI